jgi:hypothetical protein
MHQAPACCRRDRLAFLALALPPRSVRGCSFLAGRERTPAGLGEKVVRRGFLMRWNVPPARGQCRKSVVERLVQQVLGQLELAMRHERLKLACRRLANPERILPGITAMLVAVRNLKAPRKVGCAFVAGKCVLRGRAERVGVEGAEGRTEGPLADKVHGAGVSKLGERVPGRGDSPVQSDTLHCAAKEIAEAKQNKSPVCRENHSGAGQLDRRARRLPRSGHYANYHRDRAAAERGSSPAGFADIGHRYS